MDKFIRCCFTTSEKKSLSDTTQSLLILSLPVSGDWNSYLSMLGSKNSAEPVTIQPCPTGTFATSNMTTLLHTGGNWSTGLFDICSDKTICLCGLLCGPCLECRLASKYGNSLRRLDGSSLLLALCNLSNGSRNEDKTSAPGLQNASIPSSSSSSGQRCTCLKMLPPRFSLEAPLKAKRCSVFSSLQPQ